jgi:hypothetical protein
MSLNPDDYPNQMPDAWYRTFIGSMVCNLSVVRAMLRPDRDPLWNGTQYVGGTPVISVTLGEWDGDTWFGGITEAGGVLLGLDETNPDDPKIILGDYKEYIIYSSDSEDMPEPSVSLDCKVVPLKNIGTLCGIELPEEQLE